MEITMPSIIRAAWAIVMVKITQSSDITFGATLSGRNASVPGIECITGPTITTVPVRVRVDKCQKIDDFLASIQAQAVEMIPFEHVGMQNIRHICDSDSKIACDFQTLLMIRQRSNEEGDEKSHLLYNFDSTDRLADFNTYALMLVFSQSNDEIRLQASFDAKVIDTDRVKSLISQVEYILQQLCSAERSGQIINDIDCMSPQGLVDVWRWNSVLPNTIDVPAHDLFSRRARQSPNAIALSAWDGEVTYEELDDLSTRLALYLREELKIGPKVVVPLCFEKSKWTSISMLAIIKAGAAFAPMDTDQPENRLLSIIKQTRARIILCSSLKLQLASRLADLAVVVDDASVKRMQGKGNAVSNAVGPSTTMYIVFTSGSTGTPKGVVITHANLSSAVTHQAAALGFRADSRVLDFSSYSFDACVFNLFYTILLGGCLCVPSDATRKDDLAGSIKNMAINLVQLTPSVARLLDPSKIPNLQVLILTGETLTQLDIDTWKHLKLINAYGPTECTIMCAADTTIMNPGSIGRGLGSNLWIADVEEPLRLAPIGAVGEILIEGPIVGSGYLEEAAKAASTFMRDPPWLLRGVAGHSGRQGRLYRTGDLARYSSNGSLIYLGRQDTEVKLNGQRVELKEIEYHLRRNLPQSVEVVADVIIPGNREPALVAFVCLAEETDIRSRLAEMVTGIDIALEDSLPGYMVPAAYIAITRIPMTVSGKTDRKRLREVGSAIPREDMIYSTGSDPQQKHEPSTDMERRLQRLWVHVLGLDAASIGADDHFFRTGGDSIAAMRFVGAARDEGLVFTVADVFRNPQLSVLSTIARPIDDKCIDNEDEAFSHLNVENLEIFIRNEVKPKVLVSSTEIIDIVPASAFQVDSMRNLFQPLSLQYAFLDMALDMDTQRLFRACNCLLQAFETFRTVFVDHGGSFLQVVLREAPLQTAEYITKEDVMAWSTEYCIEDMAKYADLTKNSGVGELFTKFVVVTGANNQRRMILRISHSQYDGFSVPRIFTALQRAYHGQPIAPSPPYSRFIRHSIRTKPAALEYWKVLLKGSTMTPELRYEPGSGIRILRSRSIANANRPDRVRPSILVSVTWAVMLGAITGETDIVFGNVVAGRTANLPDIEKIMGPCINIIPVRFNLRPGWTFAELCQSMSHQLLEGGQHEGLDWAEMVNKCTDWPLGTRFGTAVHHRNIDWRPQVNLGGENTQVTWFDPAYDPPWSGIVAFPEDASALRVHLFASPKVMNNDAADSLLERLDDIIQSFVANLDGSLS